MIRSNRDDPHALGRLGSGLALLALGSGPILHSATVMVFQPLPRGLIDLPFKAGDPIGVGSSFVSSGNLVQSDGSTAKLSLQGALATSATVGALRAQEFCFALNLELVSAQLTRFGAWDVPMLCSLETAADGSMKVMGPCDLTAIRPAVEALPAIRLVTTPPP